MESWLPFLDRGEHVLPDLLPPGAQVVLVEPRRIRDRAVQLLDEEAALAETLAATWGAKEGEEEIFPRLHVPFERLLRDCPAGVVSVPPVPEGPSTSALTVRRFEPVAGDPARLAGRGDPARRRGVRRDAVRRHRARRRPALGRPGRGGRARPGARRGRRARRAPCVVAAPITSGFILPDAKVAVLSETDVTGRRMPHRRARPRARAADGFFDDLESGSFVVHRQHGVARFEGVTTRTMGGTTRDYLILQYRGSDRLYLPVDQIEAITPYSGGESPTLSKMGGADWQRTRAKARAAAGEVAAELVQLYRRRLAVEGHAFGPDTPWQAEMEASFPFVETEDQLKAIADVKARHGGAAADGPPGLRRRRLRQDRGGACGPSSRRCRTAGRRPSWRRPRCWPASTRRPSPTATRPTRSGSSCSAASSRRRSSGGRAGPGRRERRRGRSARTGCWRRTWCSSSSASSWSTRSSASG